MAKNKKIQAEPAPVVHKPEVVEAPGEIKQGKVKILSQRPGNIILKGGVVLKNNMIVEVDLDYAQLLMEMHPNQIRIL